MKNYKVNISTGSVLNELLAIMAKNDESSLTIDSFNKIINNSEHIVDSDEIIARVKFSGDTILEIPVVEESSAKLVKKLLPASQSTGLMRAVLDLTK